MISVHLVKQLDGRVVRRIRQKVTKNYQSWCTFVGKHNELRCGSAVQSLWMIKVV
jgi:hypothetical protein